MSATATSPTTTTTPTAQSPSRRLILPVAWLISPTADLVWIIGSVAVSYALFALWRVGTLTAEQITLLWIFAIHGPHFWATISRTFLDPTEHRERKRVLWGSLLWFLVGPIMVGAGLVLQAVTGAKDLILLFFFLAALWAYHHVVKQHFGFMALYRAKAREFGKQEFQFHKWYVMVSLWAPATIVLANNGHWLLQVPLLELAFRTYGASAAQAITDGGQLVRSAATASFWTAQGAFAASLVWRAMRGRGINLPELLVVACCVPLHWIVTRSALTTTSLVDANAFVPLVTIYHNLQYHGLVWHYNRVKYGAPGATAKFGPAAVVNRNLIVYLLCGLAYTAVTIGIEHYDIPLLRRRDAGGQIILPVGEILAAAILGFSFMHYYLDSKIWHVREDASLRKVLGFPEPPPRPAAVAAAAAPAAATA